MRQLKVLFMILVILMVTVPSFAQEEITIISTNLVTLRENYPYHTKAIDFLEPKPFFNEDGFLLVPAARYSRGTSINCRVYTSTNQVRLQSFSRELWLTVGSNESTYKCDAPKRELISDSTNIEAITEASALVEVPTIQTLIMDATPVLKDGVIYIPVEFISEIFDDEYSWDEATNTAYVKYDRLEIKEEGGTRRVEMFDVPVDAGGFSAFECSSYSCPVVNMYADMLKSDYQGQLVSMRETLLQVFDEAHVNDVMNYIDLVEDRYTKLEYKGFYNKTKDRIITVEASHGEIRVDILFKDLKIKE